MTKRFIEERLEVRLEYTVEKLKEINHFFWRGFPNSNSAVIGICQDIKQIAVVSMFKSTDLVPFFVHAIVCKEFYLDGTEEAMVRKLNSLLCQSKQLDDSKN